MSDNHQQKKLEKIISKQPSELSQDEWIELICSHCQFYHPDEEEKLECAGFKMLKEMVLNGEILLEQLLIAAEKTSFKKNG